MTPHHAAHLKAQFDASFQHPPATAERQQEEFLLIRVGHQSYALRLSQVSGVVKGKTVTPLPGAPPQLRGVACFRGQLVSVFDLAAWLGQPVGEAEWMALVEAPPSGKLALTFDAMEGQLGLDASELVAGSGETIEGLIPHGEQATIAVLSLPSLLKNLERRSQ